MKITHGSQTIDLFGKGVPKLCPISISGGADSASLLFLISKYFPEVKLMPYTCRDLNAPKDADAARDIVEWMQNRFPDNNIPDIEIYDFNDKDESFVKTETIREWQEAHEPFRNMRDRQVSKIIQVDTISWNMMGRALEIDPQAIRIDGMTRNPPSEEMKNMGFYDKAERRRDKELPHVEEWRMSSGDPKFSIYQAYANVDKKFVAGVYIDNNLMNDLFPMTRSCVGTHPELTQNFTKECGRCFWCEEKAWAWDWPVNKLPIEWEKGGVE